MPAIFIKFHRLMPAPYRLPNILISRLMLNLRIFSNSEEMGSRGHLSELNFATNNFLGNIGAPLDGSAQLEAELEIEDAERRE